MSKGSQAFGKTAKFGIALTSLFGALGAVFRVRSPQRPHDTESSGLSGTSQFSLLSRMRKVPRFVVFLGLVLVVVVASAMVRALAVSGGCATPTITWVGNASTEPDSWHTASNWDANRVPGAGDHVCIPNLANTDAITFSTGTTSVASLESEEVLNISSGTLELTSVTEDSKVNNLTLSGSGTLSGAGNLTTTKLDLLGGTLVGSGKVTVPAGGNATWSGGTMTGGGRTLISAASGSSPAAKLTISGPNGKILTSNRILENAGEASVSGSNISTGTGALIENSGTFDFRDDTDINTNFGGTTRFENSGTLRKTSGTATTDIAATVGNTGGTIDAASGTLNLGGGLNNFSSTGGVGKVAGGTYMIRSNSVLMFLNADIDVNAATIVLDGLGSAIVDQKNSDAIDNLSDNDGSFTIRADRDLRAIGALRNDGSLTIGTDSVLTTTGEYVQAAGSTVLEDTTSKLAASGARVRVQGGAMKGLGTVEPALEATGGRVQPGLSSGILKVAGSYAPGPNGTLEVEIGGPAPSSGHDQLDVGTTASLGGTLDIVTPSSFTPTPGQSFTILKCGALDCRSGQFDTVKGTNPGPRLEYQVRYNATEVTLELNNPPEANPDTAETDEDTPLNDIDVLSNDQDADGDSLSVSSVTHPSHGSTEVVDGKVNYTPNANYNGPDSFSYTISDGNGGTDTADVSVTVKAVNDAPVAKDDTAETDEDTSAIIDVLANDTDVDDGDTLSVSSFTQPANGQVSLDSGKLRYEPALNHSGPDSFTYKAKDSSNADSNEAAVSITVKAVNDAPVANADTAETDEDTATEIALLANDEDVDNTNAELSLSSFTQPSHGTVSQNGDSTLKYEPTLNYNGPDSFTYKAKDASNAESNEAKVNITVKAVNDAPTCQNLSIETDEDTPGSVAADCSDVDADTITYEIVDQATDGTASVDGGNLKYDPNANFNGSDSFTYRASDGIANSEAAKVDVKVNAVNDAPVAKEESYSTDEDNTLSVDAPGVLENDTDVDNANLTAVQISGPAHGTLTLNDNGSFEYKPQANYNGTDSFTYKANDGTEDSNLATVSITVNAVNDAPVADDQSITTDEDTPKEIALSATDVDEGDSLTYHVVSGPAHGTLSGTGANLTYTPDADFFGEDSFTFSASDGNLDSNVATVSITVNAVNDAPVPEDNSYTTPEDTPLNIGAPGLLGNDTDVEQDPLHVADGNADTADGISPVSGPANGTVELHEDGSFTYTPNTNYHGTDSFDYRVCDNGSPEPKCSVQTATVNVTIDPVNDAPEAANDANSTDEDTTLNVAAPGVLGNDTDVEDDPLTAVKVTDPAHGTLTLNADGSYTDPPNTNFNGTDSFKYKATDGTTESNEATVTITVNAVNDAPVAANDTKQTNEDTPLTFPSSDLVSNDDEGAPDEVAQDLIVTQVFDGTHGTVSLGPEGNITFTPEANFNGPATFTYLVCDNGSPSECSEQTATVNVTVNAVNDPPEAQGDTLTTDEDTVGTGNVLSNDTDVDNANLTAVLATGPSHGTLDLNDDGSYTYTPAEDYNGPDSFTYNATDGTDDSNVATVSITVNAVNDAPVAVDDTATTPEDTPVEILASELFQNDSTGPANESGQTLHISAVSGATNGQAELNGAGNVLFTPAPNFNGLASFHYTVCDNGTPEKCYEGTATVLVTVIAVNDRPVADDQLVKTNEDTAKLITLSATDVDNGSLTYKVTSLPTHGKLYKGDSQLATDEITSASSSNPVALNGNQLTYKPDPNYNNTGGATADTFKFLANDGTLDSNEATISVTVTAVNDAPVAVNDSYSTNQGNALTVNAPGVLGNDTDADNSGNTNAGLTVKDSNPNLAGVQPESQPNNGTLTLNANGSYTYTPNANFNGTDSFTYKATDGGLDSNTATVAITVTPVGTSAPMVTSVSPLDQATGVSRSTNVTATFNVAMNAKTLKSTTFILTVPGRRGPTQVSASVSCNNPCTTATLTPSKTLTANTTYTATVKGTVEDASGRKLGSDYVWRFTTGG
jgi:VCBS repeat-containing protein